MGPAMSLLSQIGQEIGQKWNLCMYNCSIFMYLQYKKIGHK